MFWLLAKLVFANIASLIEEISYVFTEFLKKMVSLATSFLAEYNTDLRSKNSSSSASHMLPMSSLTAVYSGYEYSSCSPLWVHCCFPLWILPQTHWLFFNLFPYLILISCFSFCDVNTYHFAVSFSQALPSLPLDHPKMYPIFNVLCNYPYFI